MWEYSCFIYYIRENLKEGNTPEEAVDLAVERCLKEEVLTDVLRLHKKEVVRMFLEEYDKELHERTLRRQGVEEGLEKGLEKGLQDGLEKGHKEINELIKDLFNDNRQEELLLSLDDKELQEKLLKEYGIKE